MQNKIHIITTRSSHVVHLQEAEELETTREEIIESTEGNNWCGFMDHVLSQTQYLHSHHICNTAPTVIFSWTSLNIFCQNRSKLTQRTWYNRCAFTQEWAYRWHRHVSTSAQTSRTDGNHAGRTVVWRAGSNTLTSCWFIPLHHIYNVTQTSSS